MTSTTNKDRGYAKSKGSKAKKVAELMGGGGGKQRNGGSIYSEFSDASIAYAVRVVTSLGGALLLSQTSDGFTGSMTIFYENERIKGYIMNPADPSQALIDWIEKFRIAVEETE